MPIESALKKAITYAMMAKHETTIIVVPDPGGTAAVDKSHRRDRKKIVIAKTLSTTAATNLRTRPAFRPVAGSGR
jgi:hypothetical protein